PRQKAEVVVDDVRLNGQRGDVDQARTRLSQQEEEKEEALLVRLLMLPLQHSIDRQGRDDDDRLGIWIEGLDGVPEGNQLVLERLELRSRVGCVRESLPASRFVLAQ